MIKFAYRMNLAFDRLVHEHHFTLKCIPASSTRQTVTDINFQVDPLTPVWYGGDGFGNRKVMGYIRDVHDHLNIAVSGKAQIAGSRTSDPRKDATDVILMKYPTTLTKAGPAVRALLESAANACRLTGSAGDVHDFASCVMRAVHGYMTYAPGRTWIDTDAEEAAAAGQGVCQDYAHIMLAILRLQGIPCRYVCGILSGEGASHAWVEVWEEDGWTGYDPTNEIPADRRHLVLSCGRDAGDCEINRGILFAADGGLLHQTQTVTSLLQEL